MSGLDQYDNPLNQRIKSLRQFNREQPPRARKAKPSFDKRKFCTVQDLISRWGVSAPTVYSIINDGHIEAFRLSKQYRIKIDSVLAFEATGGAC